jgi:hypothetical protein
MVYIPTINLQIPTEFLPFFWFEPQCKGYARVAAIKIIMRYRQEYQHQYSRDEKMNSLVDVAREPTIVEDVVAGTNIARITILTPTKRKSPNRSGEERSRRPYL